MECLTSSLIMWKWAKFKWSSWQVGTIDWLDNIFYVPPAILMRQVGNLIILIYYPLKELDCTLKGIIIKLHQYKLFRTFDKHFSKREQIRSNQGLKDHQNLHCVWYPRMLVQYKIGNTWMKKLSNPTKTIKKKNRENIPNKIILLMIIKHWPSGSLIHFSNSTPFHILPLLSTINTSLKNPCPPRFKEKRRKICSSFLDH